MKKLLLATVLTVAAFAVVDADARYWRRGGCDTGCNTQVSCEKPACETKCFSECNPCKPKCCRKTYKVVDETPCEAPLCVKYVPTTAPAVCHRVCRWECPAGYEPQGSDEATVSGEYKLVNQNKEETHVNANVKGSSNY